ncbi:MAG: beta-lactamase family protein [Planctomycetaceae bacterium]|nr:beta-lactamase family protein [Planctomycetaceae bacterium]
MSKNLSGYCLGLLLGLALAWPTSVDAQGRLGRGARSGPTGQQEGPQATGASGLASPTVNSELDKAIEAHFAEKKLPGLVVLYARDGMLVYKKNLGFADVASQTKVNENHVFRLASVSKLLAAVLALREEEKGNLNLSAHVSDLLSDIPAHHAYQVRDLVSCRSGVRHYNEPTSDQSPSDWDQETYATSLEAAQQFWHDPLAGPIGSYHYSSHGYTILGACLEQATGKTTAQLIKQTLANPHGLGTLAAEDLSVNQPQRVAIYTLNNADSVASGNREIERESLSWKILGGGLECSGLDLLKFGIKLCDGKIISAANVKKLMKRLDPSDSYALGCSHAVENGVEVFAKNGGQPGASTYMWCIPERRMVMVVLTNRWESGGATELGKELRDILLNSEGASGQSPDLIVENFQRTSGPSYSNGAWEIGFEFEVKNQGLGPANIQFVNGIRLDNQYRWSGFMETLAPNGVKKKSSGKVKINDPGKVMGGRKFEFFAVADAPIAAADTSMSPNGRIAETSEANNTAKLVVTLPGGIGDLQGNAGDHQAPSRKPGSSRPGASRPGTLTENSGAASGEVDRPRPGTPPQRVPRPNLDRDNRARDSEEKEKPADNTSPPRRPIRPTRVPPRPPKS